MIFNRIGGALLSSHNGCFCVCPAEKTYQVKEIHRDLERERERGGWAEVERDLWPFVFSHYFFRG